MVSRRAGRGKGGGAGLPRQPDRGAAGEHARAQGADYEIPADFDLRAFVGRPAWRLDDEEPVAIEVRFRFPASVLAARNAEGELVAEGPDGSAVRRFEVTDTHPFFHWVLSFAGEAVVVAPAEARAGFRAMAADIAALYGAADA